MIFRKKNWILKNFTKEFQGIFKEISRNFAEFSREKTVLVASRIGAFKENSRNSREISRNFKDGSVSPGASIMGASTLWGHIMYFLMFDIYSVTAGVCWGPHVAA